MASSVLSCNAQEMDTNDSRTVSFQELCEHCKRMVLSGLHISPPIVPQRPACTRWPCPPPSDSTTDATGSVVEAAAALALAAGPLVAAGFPVVLDIS